MLLVRFSFCECGSVVCKSPRPAQRSVLASSAPRPSVVKARVSKAKRSMAVAPYQRKGDHHNPGSPGRDRMPPRTQATSPMRSHSTVDRLERMLAELREGMAADHVPLARSIERLRRAGVPPAEIERVARA